LTAKVSGIDATAAEFDLEARQYQKWSPGDVLRLIVGLAVLLLGLFLAAVAQNTIAGAEQDIVSWFNRLPDRAIGLVIGAGQLIAVVVPVTVWVLLLWRRQFRLLGMQLLAVNVAAWAMTAIEARYADRLGVIEDAHTITRGWIADTSYPTSSAVAASAAFVAVTAPWLSRRWRRATWGTLIVLVLLRIVGSGEPPLDIIVAIAMGLVVGSLALLVFGSPSPAPRVTELVGAMRSAGLMPIGIRRMHDDGSSPHFAVDVEEDRGTLFVKVRSPNDRSSDLLNRLWGSVRLRSSEVERPFSSLKRQVEHEAFAATLARDRGAEVPRAVALGATGHGAVFLASTWVEGTPIADADPAQLTDEVLNSLWSQIALLGEARVAHRNLSLNNMLLDGDDNVWLVDFDRADIAANERDLARDVAELLVSLSARLGVERPVATAVDVLGDDVMVECLPQLQPLALPPDVRKLTKRHKGLFDEITLAVRDATGAPEAQFEQLERIKPKTVLMIVAGSLAFYALLPQLANIDETTDALADANLWWLPAVLAGSATTYLFATLSALGAYSLTLPVMATLRSQLASSFTALVAPANAGGMALGVRFLQKAGFETAEASSAVGLNTIGGIVAHIVLLFAFVSWTGQTGVGNIELPDTSTALIVITAIVVLSGALLLFGPIRRRVLGPVVRILKSVGGQLGGVFASPARVLALFGGSALVTLAYAMTLVFSVEAFGGGLTILEISTAFIVATTIATIAPTPGGLGALEAAMIASLSGFGMDHGPAVGAVLAFRLATFWLPILPGWFTFGWMERNGEL
jgi:uncharacterized membrane protein YbhN (UPF0104 family)/tRNA A-37 threonylcarbamoyl transferase component Bud32